MARRLWSRNALDVDRGGDDRLGLAEVLVVLDVRRARRRPADRTPRSLADAADDVVAVHRRLVDARRLRGQLGGAVADAVHLDVVRVAVAAVVVVDREHVGVLFVEDRGEPAGRLVDVGRPERARDCRSRACPSSPSRRSRGTRHAARPGSRLTLASPPRGAATAAPPRRGNPRAPRRSRPWSRPRARRDGPATPPSPSRRR